jgi:pantetheine-phosphate adenylyltransferase
MTYLKDGRDDMSRKNKVTRAIYSGTFDPITNGHMDIIKRALKVFDEVIVAIGVSRNKNPMFRSAKRLDLVQKATKDLNVTAKVFDSLLVEFAKKEDVKTIVRGLRAVSDFESELQMGYANSSLDSEIDTMYFMPTLNNAFVSSTVVREILRFDGRIDHLVPLEILGELKCT